jgi:hypothetical protein
MELVFTLSTFQRTLSKLILGLCGANRDRTDNLRLARAALSQLSYSPRLLWVVIRHTFIHTLMWA